MAAFSFGGGVFEILFFLFIFAAILFLAYITTKVMAKKSGIRAKSKYMEIVDKLDFGPDKQLYILRAGDEYYLISKSSKNVDFLTKVDITFDDDENDANLSGGKLDFKSLLEKHVNFGIMKKDPRNSKLKNNIGRIRSMSENRASSEDEGREGEDTDV